MNYRQLSRLSHKEQNQGEVSANGTVTPATNRASSNVSMAVLDRYLSYGVWLLNDEQMAAHQMRLDREKRVSWARFLTSSSLIAAATISFVHSFTRSHLHDLRTSNSCRVKFSGNIARHRFPLFGISNSLSFFLLSHCTTFKFLTDHIENACAIFAMCHVRNVQHLQSFN